MLHVQPLHPFPHFPNCRRGIVAVADGNGLDVVGAYDRGFTLFCVHAHRHVVCVDGEGTFAPIWHRGTGGATEAEPYGGGGFPRLYGVGDCPGLPFVVDFV